MRFVFASYVYSPNFHEPAAWLKRINAYAGIQEALSRINEVISIEQINYRGRHLSGGVDYRFERYPSTALRYYPRKLNRFIKSLQPDVVVIQSLNFPLQVMLLRLVLGRRVKIMVQNHAERPAIGFRKRLQRLADNCIDAYVFASYAMGIEWVAAGNLASAAKIHEAMEVSSVFYPVNREVAKQHTGVTGNPVFLWIGRLNTNKDPVNVVKAFLRFTQQEPNARLYMIYHTDELLLDVQALLDANPHVGHNVVLVGKMPHHELLYWLNSADFIISGSHYEGSGAAVCEAMSCGCVPVVTDILSFRMITNNGDCGILYPPGNEDALVEALYKTRKIDLWDKRKRSLEYFQTNLSFQAIALQIERIAHSL
jgi:glycosyltransferase involved in cell wall biosynthesis